MTGCPARYDEELGYWVVDDPALAREVLLDPATFRPDNAVLAHTPLSVKALRVLSGVGFALPPTLANNAGESHRPIRAAVARFFSPARVAAAEPLARELTAARVAEATKVVERDGQVDLVQAVAAEPPALVVLDMLGLTEVDVPALKAWSLDSLELFWGWPDEDRQLELAHSAAEFYAWLRSRTTAARQAPGDDLFGVLVALGLTDEEVCAVGYFLLIAGQETTTQLISTTFHHTLLAGGDPAAVVEDVLREASSVPTWRRVTAGPAVVGDVELPGGAPVLARALWARRAGGSRVRGRRTSVSGGRAGSDGGAGCARVCGRPAERRTAGGGAADDRPAVVQSAEAADGDFRS